MPRTADKPNLPGRIMPAERYKTVLQKLDLPQQRAGLLLGHTRRAGQNWARRGAPPTVAAILNLMEAEQIDASMLERIMRERGPFEAVPNDLAILISLMEYFAVGVKELEHIMRKATG